MKPPIFAPTPIDGYPTGAGQCLVDNYRSKDKIDRLFDFGDLNTLGRETHKDAKIEGTGIGTYSTKYDGYREDDSTASQVYPSLHYYLNMVAPHSAAAFIYLWEAGKWEAFKVEGKNTIQVRFNYKP